MGNIKSKPKKKQLIEDKEQLEKEKKDLKNQIDILMTQKKISDDRVISLAQDLKEKTERREISYEDCKDLTGLTLREVNKKVIELLPLFSNVYIYSCYDGDTFSGIILDDNHERRRVKMRLYNYDSPELKSKDPKEKERAYQSKEILEKLILGKIIQVKTLPIKEKFGRVLVSIIGSDGKDIVEWLVANKYGNYYDGGTKEKFNFDEEEISVVEDLKKILLNREN